MTSNNEPDNAIQLKDLLDNLNPRFYDWLNDILELNVSRTLQLCTYLVNFFIYANYFPNFDVLNEQLPSLMPKNLTRAEYEEFQKNYEVIYGIFVLMNLNHAGNMKLSQEKTDEKINALKSKGPLVNKFFYFNQYPSQIALEGLDLNFLQKFLEGQVMKKNLLPELGFDPLFDKILKSDAIKHLFFVTTPKNLLKPKKEIEGLKYFPEKSLASKLLKSRKDYRSKLFDVDSKLLISKFFLKKMNDIGAIDFGSHLLIDDIVEMFASYYAVRLPSKKSEILSFLTCFGELLKFSKGQLFVKAKKGKLIKILKSKVSKQDAQRFFSKTCLNKNRIPFSDSYSIFNAKKFLRKYHDFLRFACYQDSGIVYTGVYLIWRAFIKYIESLQGEKEFRDKKSALLEKWCFDTAIQLGFKHEDMEKIVLINPKRTPTKLYYKMIEQTKTFPKPRCELEAEFPGDFNTSYFEEIDLALRVKDYLFLFECKGTSVPISEHENFITWSFYFNENMNHLLSKADLLFYNLENGDISHPLLKKLEKSKCVPVVFQTEGIIMRHMNLSIDKYAILLKELKKHREKDTLDAFFEKMKV